MLDSFIIDQLKKREQQRRQDDQRPRLELPLEQDDPKTREKDEEKKDGERGVFIIDMGGPE